MDTRHHAITIWHHILHERSHAIPTIPFAYNTELLTHGWGNHGWLMKKRWWWRLQRSPTSEGQSPSWQGARARTSVLRIGVFDGGGALLHFWKIVGGGGPHFRSGATYTRKDIVRRATKARATPGRGTWGTRGQGPPPLMGGLLRVAFWLRGSFRPKLHFLFFLEYSGKLYFCIKKDTKCNSIESSVSPC